MCAEYFLIPDDAVDRRKLGFQFLVFKQQCKASIGQFLYIFNHAAEGQHEQIIQRSKFTVFYYQYCGRKNSWTRDDYCSAISGKFSSSQTGHCMCLRKGRFCM